MSNTEFPKRMVHPAYKKSDPKPVPGTEIYKANGEIKTAHYRGEPDRFPPVDVPNADQEAQYRAKGYLPYGETPMNVVAFKEYPLMLSHPDYEPAVEAIVEQRDANGKLVSAGIPGTPAKLAPVQVNDPDDEAKWTDRGYERPGKSDPEAVQASISSPYVPGRVASEYPKMVGGVLVQDPSLPAGPAEYPKWVSIKDHPHGGKEVRSRAEEIALTGESSAEDKAAKAQAKADRAAALKAEAERLAAEAEAEMDEATAPEPAQSDEYAALLTEAEGRGIKVDKRWGIERLRNAVKATAAA